MTDITQRISQIRLALDQATGQRPAPRLVAVSKTRSAAEIRQAYAAGVTDFGESYLNEALEKIAALGDLPLCWHFIGPVQSNKTRGIAQQFHWLHSLDRLRIAQRLDRDRPADLPPLQVLIQVNIDAEPQKGGVLPAELPALITQVRALPRLRLRGLMAIPAPGGGATAFPRMQALFAQHADQGGPDWDSLSMGMSNDYLDAVAAGANLVRIGTAIFGPRGT